MDHLYRLRFRQTEVWPEATAPTGHAIDHTSDLNLPADSVDVEIYESWLLPASAAGKAVATSEVSRESLHGLHSGCGSGHGSRGHYEHHHQHQHQHEEQRRHHHEPHHEPNPQAHPSSADEIAAPSAHDHAHLARPELECVAVRPEGPPRPGAAMHQALVHLLTQKRLLQIDRLVATVEAIELSGRQMLGSRLVARAWLDEGFRARLLQDAMIGVSRYKDAHIL